MPFFRKKPVVVEAVQWTGDNIYELRALGREKLITSPETAPIVRTANGLVALELRSWLVCDPESGDTWPVAERIFDATYEVADPVQPTRPGRA